MSNDNATSPATLPETAMTNIDPIEQLIVDIAETYAVFVARFDGEPLEDFADRVMQELTDKINEIAERIEEIQSLDLDGDEEGC